MNEPSKLDKFISKVKSHPAMTLLITLITVVVTLSTFTNAAKNITGLFAKEEGRPAVNGEWRAVVTYDWDNAVYTETFTFSGEGTELYGSASFLKVKRGILEGKAEKGGLQFIIKTKEILNNDETKDVVHRYRGKLSGNEIHFVMQTEGGFNSHVPIEFVAKKVSAAKPSEKD